MIFNAAWQKFIVEGAPPATESDDRGCYQCKYLTKDGRKCAVGLCIPDGHELQKSGKTLRFLVEENCTDIFNIVGKEISIQRELHDVLSNPYGPDWNYSLEERKQFYTDFAKEFNLTIPGE